MYQQSVQQLVQQSVQQSIQQSNPQLIPQSIQQPNSQSIPKSTPQSIPQSMAQPISQPLQYTYCLAPYSGIYPYSYLINQPDQQPGQPSAQQSGQLVYQQVVLSVDQLAKQKKLSDDQKKQSDDQVKVQQTALISSENGQSDSQQNDKPEATPNSDLQQNGSLSVIDDQPVQKLPQSNQPANQSTQGKMPSSLKQKARQATPYSRPPDSGPPDSTFAISDSTPTSNTPRKSPIISNGTTAKVVHCKTCNLNLQSKRAYFDHIASQSHKLQESKTKLICEVCQVEIAGLSAYVKHLSGSEHIETYENLVSLNDHIHLSSSAENQIRLSVCWRPSTVSYLHIGHAKEFFLAKNRLQTLKGQLVFRIDDFEPPQLSDLAEACDDFMDALKQDLASLKIWPDIRSFTSDYFDFCLESCERLIREGKAYCGAEGKSEANSKDRQNSVEQNLAIWEKMLKGGDKCGVKCCVRAKYKSNSEDSVLYRVKAAIPHPRSGTKFKVYPTIVFAQAIADHREAITHKLRRTNQPLGFNKLYDWLCDALLIRKPSVEFYPRLLFNFTTFQNDSLAWLVKNKKVFGWDDPRMPTIRGLLRGGLTVDALKEFCSSHKSSDRENWKSIWAINERIVRRRVHRFMGIVKENYVKVTIENLEKVLNKQEIDIERQPKRPEFGTRKLKVPRRVSISQEDAVRIEAKNKPVKFVGMRGRVVIDRIIKDNRAIREMNVRLELTESSGDSLNVVWVDPSNVITAHCHYPELLFNKPSPVGALSDSLNEKSWTVVEFQVERRLTELKKGEMIELYGRGLFIYDNPYELLSAKVLDNLRLFAIPDGTDDLARYPNAARVVKRQVLNTIAENVKNAKTKDAKDDEEEVQEDQEADSDELNKSG